MNESGVVNKVAARLSLDITPAQAQLQQLSDGIKTTLGDAAKALNSAPRSNGDVYLQQENGAIMTLRQSIKELQLQWKEGQLAAEDYYSRLASLRQTYASALDPTTSVGFMNDQALRSAIVEAQNQLSKLQDFELQSERALEQQQAAFYAEDQKNYFASVDNKVKEVKMLHDLQLQSAQDSLAQLSAIYEEDYARFADDIDKKTALLKQMYTYEKEAAAQANASQMVSNRSSSSPGSSSSGHGYFGGVGLVGMGEMMAEFTGISMLMQNVMTGLVQINQQQQGLEQVFGENVKGQQELNDVTNQFIDIAKQYGQSVTSVLDAAKQWGRQYHDVATAQALVHSSTLLSIVDNMDMTDSAKALEATMNAMGMSVKNAADAQQSSMAIVDQWSNMAHNASVSAQDLAQGTQVAAGAAHQAGMSIEQLNALIAAGVRNSGLSGNNIGNMFKTVLANISTDTPKIQAAFKELGISMTEVGTDGKQHMKPVYDLLVEMAAKSDDLDSAQQKAMLTITRGVQQYSKFAEAISNVNTIQNDYNIAMNSAGAANKYAQEQLNTLAADLTRLRDTIQQIAYNAGQGGLGDVLKTLVVDITSLLNGLQKLPAGLDYTIAGLTGILMTGRMLTSVMNAVSGSIDMVRAGLTFWVNAASNSVGAVTSLAGATTALTADLNAKVIATEADIAANEQEIVAAGEATAALEAETVAAGEAAAAFTVLDVVSGGLTLAIGAAVTGIALLAMHLGQQQQVTDQTTQSTEQLNQAIQQETQQSLNAAQQTEQHVSALMQLTTQFQNAKKALDDAKSGSDAYKQAEANLISIEQQLASIVGQAAAQRIIASKNIVQATNDEAKAMIQTQITELKAEQLRAEQQASLTSAVVQETMKRIQAYEAEANAAQAAYDKTQTGAMATRFGLDTSGRVLGTAPNPANDIAQAHMVDETRAEQYQRMAMQFQMHQNMANDPFQAEIDKLQLLLQNPSMSVSGTVPGVSLGGVTGPSGSSGSTKSGASASQNYLDRFSKLSQTDDMGLQIYEQRISKASNALDTMNGALSNGLKYLQSHATDTKAASDAIKAYNDDVKALNDHANALAGENWQLQQELNGVSSKMKQVEADQKAGRIDADTYRQAIYDLTQEYDRLTSTLNSNTQAIQQDKDAIAQATASITSEIVSMLQTAYQDQQKIQEDALQNIYQPQIDALTKQKDAIDQVIQSLQAQWQAQDQVNKLQDLQNQLTQVMADKRFEVVGTDGKLTYTYDTAKAADLQKQIADQQTQIQHDAQIKQLNDQKAALDTEIKNLQDTYNQKKQQLDDYWQWKMSTDQLNQDADNLIQKDGLDKALKTVQDYTNKVVAQYNQIQAAAAAAGAAIAGGLGGAGIGGGGGLPSWVRGAISAGFGGIAVGSGSLLGGMLGTLHFAKGGEVPNIGIPGVDSVPAMLTPGEIIAPSWNDLTQTIRPQSMTQTIQSVTLELPNVRTATDVPKIADALASLGEKGYHVAIAGGVG